MKLTCFESVLGMFLEHAVLKTYNTQRSENTMQQIQFASSNMKCTEETYLQFKKRVNINYNL